MFNRNDFARTVCAAAAASVIVIGTFGCATQPKQTTLSSKGATPAEITAKTGGAARATSLPADSASAAGADPMSIQPQLQNLNVPEIVQRTTTEYSKQMEAALAAKPQPHLAASAPSGAKPKSPMAVAAVPKDSPVEFGTPNDFTLGYSDNSKKEENRKLASPAILDTTPSELNPATPGDNKPSAEPNTGASLAPNAMDQLPNTKIEPKRSQLNGDSMDNFSLKLEKRTKDNPRDVSSQLDLQLIKFITDERVPDQAAIATLPSEDREMISALVDGLSNFRSALRADNNMLLSRKVKPLLEMSDRLRSQADLMIPTMALCTSVRTFGEYDPIEPCRFTAAKPHDVILYCEIENFSSQQDASKQWQTKITKDAVLYSEDGLPVWNDKSETITDSSRRRRHDFFLVKKLTIPPTLQTGRYLLKVTIVDNQVSRVAEATVPIIISAM